jgi:hypothetical protein
VKVLEPFNHPAVVEMHLPGGFTRVRLFALGNGEGWWEVPTERIPPHLRALGSRILVTTPRFSVEPEDLPSDIRYLVHDVLVEDLNAADDPPG